MPVQDRTNEFRACVESIRNRSSYPSKPEHKQRFLNGHGKAQTGSKSEFSKIASEIGKDISLTTLKLGKLAQLAKRKTLFDDRPVEISELTFIIKQDISNINKQLATLQAHVKLQQTGSKGSTVGNKQVEEHNANVVTLLQSKVMQTTMTFKDVLEIRTQNMKETKDRTEKFVSSTASAAIAPPPSSSLLFQQPRNDDSRYNLQDKGKGRIRDSDLLALDMVATEEGHANGAMGGMQELQYMDNQQDYIQSRSTAIESIEATISELGSIFSQLAHMVAEQRETVQRIDADTTDIADNISGAQRELLKYYASISSNRWLMIKIFGVLIVVFLLFVLVN